MTATASVSLRISGMQGLARLQLEKDATVKTHDSWSLASVVLRHVVPNAQQYEVDGRTGSTEEPKSNDVLSYCVVLYYYINFPYYYFHTHVFLHLLCAVAHFWCTRTVFGSLQFHRNRQELRQNGVTIAELWQAAHGSAVSMFEELYRNGNEMVRIC